MKYMELSPSQGHIGDSVCFLSACRKFATDTEDTVCVSVLPEIVDAYADPSHLRFGRDGEYIKVTPWEHHRKKESIGFGNYYGTFLASMGMKVSGLPELVLPRLPSLGESFSIIQPFSVHTPNQTVEYVQQIVDTFTKLTGEELVVVGGRSTPRVLNGVRYALKDDLIFLMMMVQDARFVLTPRSLTANLAAGYHRPAFIWMPDDGEGWHLDYPNWDREVVLFTNMEKTTEGLESIVSRRVGQCVASRKKMTVRRTVVASCRIPNIEDDCAGVREDRDSDFCIVTAYSSELDWTNLGQLTSRNKSKYCEKWNYGFRAYTAGFDTDRSLSWSKWIFIKNALKRYKWVFWMDADTAITNLDKRLEGLIGEDDIDIVIARHGNLREGFRMNFKEGLHMDVGVFLIRGGQFADYFLETMWANGGKEETEVFDNLHKDGMLDGHVRVENGRVFNSVFDSNNGHLDCKWEPGDFILHLASMGVQSKTKAFSDLLNDDVISFEDRSSPLYLVRTGTGIGIGSSLVALPVVSVVVETRQEFTREIRRIVDWHRRWFRFHREVVISTVNPQIPGVEFICCGVPPTDHFRLWYSDMCVHHLAQLCDASHILLWQWDGFIVNPRMWTDDFLNWDYIGAPVANPRWEMTANWLRGLGVTVGACEVGNGGFSLRSRRFLEATASLSRTGMTVSAEDVYICIERRAELERMGMRFCPMEIAERFSKDEYSRRPITDVFGFHGAKLFNEVRQQCAIL